MQLMSMSCSDGRDTRLQGSPSWGHSSDLPAVRFVLQISVCNVPIYSGEILRGVNNYHRQVSLLLKRASITLSVKPSVPVSSWRG